METLNKKDWLSKKDWQAGLTSYLVKVGTTEDGEDVIRELFRVACVNSFGDRFESKFSSFDRSEANRFCNKVVIALHRSKADPSLSKKWFRGRAVYGSAAYTAYGQAEEVAWERKAEGR